MNHQIENARYSGKFPTESRVTEVLLLLLMDCSHDMRFVSMLSRSPNCGLLHQAMVKSIIEDNKPGRPTWQKGGWWTALTALSWSQQDNQRADFTLPQWPKERQI